jgi:hypothetical protein
MNLDFDLENISTTELGFGLNLQDSRCFFVIAIDPTVQTALADMVRATNKSLDKVFQKSGETTAIQYEPSEKYSSVECLTLALDSEMITIIKELHEAVNLDNDTGVLNKMDDCFAYFARFVDTQGRKLTAVRRASQFKGVLKKKMIQFLDDSLKMIDDRVFKLDEDFDYLVDSIQVYILRPSGLEFTAQLQDEIKKAVPANIKEIQKEMAFVDFSGISEYAQKHPRAARYLASIKSRGEAQNVDAEKLKSYCQKTGVAYVERDGKVVVEDKAVMGFLEVLDRRRYEVDLVVQEEPEIYRATGRAKTGGEVE